MTAKTITGTWEEISEHQSELQGHQLSVTILPEQEPQVPDWIMEYALKMKNRTSEEIEDVRKRSQSASQPEFVLPPGKTALDVYLELARQIAEEEPETEEEARALDKAIEELS